MPTDSSQSRAAAIPTGLEVRLLRSCLSDARTWTADAATDEALKALTGVNDVIPAGDRFVIADDADGYRDLAVDGTLTRTRSTVSPYGYPTGGTRGLAWLGQPDGGTCSAAWIRMDRSWRIVRPAASICAAPVSLGFGSQATSFVDHGLALPDGFLILSTGTKTDSEALFAIRPAKVVPADAPVGPAPAPPRSAIPVPPMEALTPHGQCATGAVTIATLVAVEDRNDRVACFGGRALTFRAWVVDPGEGYGGTCRPMTPTWLQPCVLPDWLLAADKASTERLDGVRSPGATGDLQGVARWVNVTGHFDDAASSTCRTTPVPAMVGQPPLAYFVYRCREQFAVTRIETTA